MYFSNRLHQWRKTLEGICYPPRCVICDGILEPGETGIHRNCQKKLYPVKEPLCMHCGKPVSLEKYEYCPDCSRKLRAGGEDTITQGKALYLYQGEIKKSMYRLKYANRREYGAYFAKEAYERYGEWIKQCGIEVLIPVPMYRKKEKQRGYNQAKVFAKELSYRTKLPIDGNFVYRIRNTAPQKELNDLNRKNNLKNAFHIPKNIVKYNRILLIDDIYTTGSTADELATTFHKNGVEVVYFMSICIGAGN